MGFVGRGCASFSHAYHRNQEATKLGRVGMWDLDTASLVKPPKMKMTVPTSEVVVRVK